MGTRIGGKALIRVSDVRRWEKWIALKTKSHGSYAPPSSKAIPLGRVKGEPPALDIRVLNLVQRIRENEVDRTAGKMIPHAFAIAQKGHAGIYRRSGEAYIHHPVTAAEIIVRWGLGENEAVAAICHDLREDAGVLKEFLRSNFGERVAFLVEGVTELGKEQEYTGSRPTLVEISGKRLEYGARDLAVILIRLADRLHNMRTLEYMKPKKQWAKAIETLYIHSKEADILGIWDLKRELGDLSFKYLKREDGFKYTYDEINTKRKQIIRHSWAHIKDIVLQINERLSRTGLNIRVEAENRRVYEIYERMQRRDFKLESLAANDVWRINITVPNENSCFPILGIVHGLFRPVPGEFNDYISDPQPNGHQFLHTYVQTPGFGRLLIQIRDRKMNEAYHNGILSEIKGDKDWYKKGGRWLDAMLEYLKSEGASERNLYEVFGAVSSPIYVYTRDGEQMQIPFGSTPLDFAFRIHSKVFLLASGVNINHRPSLFSQTLRDGDEVEIFKGDNPSPSLEWFDWIRRTPHATELLSGWFRRQKDGQARYRRAIEYLDRRTKRFDLPAVGLLKTEFMRKVLEDQGYKDVDTFIFRVGIGKVDVESFLDYARERYLQEINTSSAAEKRLLGVTIIGEDRPGLLSAIARRLKRQMLNIAKGDFGKISTDQGERGIMNLYIEQVAGPGGAVQKLQVEEIIRKVSGVERVNFSSAR
jgi:GTP pyrophosphokinase